MNLQDLTFEWTDSSRLDCHAHIAPDATKSQIAHLGDALIFAMTRSLDAAEWVSHRGDDRVLWGCGVHPRDADALHSFTVGRFERLSSRFTLFGEVGLDGEGDPSQMEVIRDILRVLRDRSVMLSLHTRGAEKEMLSVLHEFHPLAPILHWYSGPLGLIPEFVELGCFFSVSARTRTEVLSKIPSDRILTETDFPATRRHGGTVPGATDTAELRLGEARGESIADARRLVWGNLRALVLQAGLTPPPAWPEVQDMQPGRPTLF
jgi:TatD DNase family protein